MYIKIFYSYSLKGIMNTKRLHIYQSHQFKLLLVNQSCSTIPSGEEGKAHAMTHLCASGQSNLEKDLKK